MSITHIVFFVFALWILGVAVKRMEYSKRDISTTEAIEKLKAEQEKYEERKAIQIMAIYAIITIGLMTMLDGKSSGSGLLHIILFMIAALGMLMGLLLEFVSGLLKGSLKKNAVLSVSIITQFTITILMLADTREIGLYFIQDIEVNKVLIIAASLIVQVIMFIGFDIVYTESYKRERRAKELMDRTPFLHRIYGLYLIAVTTTANIKMCGTWLTSNNGMEYLEFICYESSKDCLKSMTYISQFNVIVSVFVLYIMIAMVIGILTIPSRVE